MKIDAKDLEIRDPFILVDDGKYYLYGSSNKANEIDGTEQMGFASFVSEDLITFDGPYHAFDGVDFWGEKHYWAPEVYKVGEYYYMFATFYAESEGRRCQILRSDNPLTGFVPYSNPITPKGWMCLDATLFFFNGKPYTVFCREWLEVHNGEMWISELSSDLKCAVGEPKKLFSAMDAKWVKPIDSEGKNAITDGPFLYTLKSGKIIMLWSSFKGDYAFSYAINDGEDITSGWKVTHDTLFDKDGGHAMIFEKDGKPFVVFHTPNLPYQSERIKIMKVIDDGEGITLED